MSDAELNRLAHHIAAQWTERGDSPETSWVQVTPVLEAAGVRNAWAQARAIRANLDADLYLLKKAQVGGQRRRVLFVRLAEGLPLMLMGIRPSKVLEHKAQLLRSIQRKLAQIVTEILFGTGDGQRAALDVRALYGEMTGIQLPLFDSCTYVAPRPPQRETMTPPPDLTDDMLAQLVPHLVKLRAQSRDEHYFLFEAIRNKEPYRGRARREVIDASLAFDPTGKCPLTGRPIINPETRQAIAGAFSVHHSVSRRATLPNGLAIHNTMNRALNEMAEAPGPYWDLIMAWRAFLPGYLSGNPTVRAWVLSEAERIADENSRFAAADEARCEEHLRWDHGEGEPFNP